MSQPGFPAVDTPDMDDAMSVDVPVTHQPAPARATAATSGRGRGRGRWTRTKSTRVTKPAQPKAPAGRGRRHKVYESVKLQAAHERTQELKQVFSSVVKLVKPAVQEIADRSVNELLENPAIYKQVPEYDECKKFLRQRHAGTVEQCNERLRMGLAMTEHVWKAQQEKVHEEFAVRVHRRFMHPSHPSQPDPQLTHRLQQIKVGELCEERYGQLLRQVDILDFLYDNRLPLNVSCFQKMSCLLLLCPVQCQLTCAPEAAGSS